MTRLRDIREAPPLPACPLCLCGERMARTDDVVELRWRTPHLTHQAVYTFACTHCRGSRAMLLINWDPAVEVS